ncbi:MAG: hypothetical protein ACK5HY_17670 [Parahaliea sp.]
MAEIIRQTHRLPTVRIGFQPSRAGGLVLFDSFDGGEMVSRQECPATDIGIQPELNVRAYRDVIFHMSEALCSAIGDSLKAIAPDESPLWLQVGSSSGHLAVVPWERLLHGSLNAPVLRIPNFITDPVLPRGPIRMVLCLSSPRAKTPFDLVGYVHEFVATAEHALPSGAELHLFTDLGSYDSVSGLEKSGPFNVRVHNPRDAEAFGIGGNDRRLEHRTAVVKSPWLHWMIEALGGASVAAVHFVCPGYFSRDQGALALARSPTDNYDSDWSHFVGAEELIAFLNQVGAWYTGFSPPHDNVWAIGLRLLADRIVWQRPGALLLHDTAGGGLDELLEAFRFLFTGGDAMPPRSPYIVMYCHPARLPQYRYQFSNFESVKPYGLTEPEMTRPEFDELALKMSASAAAEDVAQVGWQQSGLRMMDQILLQSKGKDTATQLGTLDALNRLSSLFEDGDS